MPPHRCQTAAVKLPLLRLSAGCLSGSEGLPLAENDTSDASDGSVCEKRDGQSLSDMTLTGGTHTAIITRLACHHYVDFESVLHQCLVDQRH